LKLIPHAGGGYRNTPLNSEPFQQDFLFLSYEEYKFFQHLLNGPKTIKHWLNENRKPIPHF
jgi:hypothetical protein